MVIWDWFREQFNKDINTLELDVVLSSLAAETFYMELAVQACINLIANAVSRADFLTYEEGKETKKDNYYLFNVEPNPNKSASKFWRDVVSNLVRKNETLIIQQSSYFYVADSFNCNRFAFKEYIYDGIVIDNYSLKNSYTESDVLHLELHNDKIKKVIDKLNKSYAKLIDVSQKNYKRNNSRKITVNLDAKYSQKQEDQQQLKDLLEKRMGDFLNAESAAALPLTNGEEIEELDSNIGVKGGADNKEIRAFIDDVFDFVAMGFQISPKLLKGEVQDTQDAVNNFLTFCVNPIAETIEDEVNRKYYKKEAYLNNTYMRVDTSNIKAVDITKVSESLDKLLSIGGYSIDDVLKKLGKEPLNTEWSQIRWMTKNYEPAKRRYEGGE
ncbi:MAG: HK97 family phage portal protein [Candidatus Frackibacter sp. T328-2]|nr:MAG: HK97 family phage portal protein [Candidatus Frackibacter sp. T328-2]